MQVLESGVARLSDPLIQIRNHHSLSCGDPPKVDGTSGKQYIGYFENPFGEQWIFIYDRDDRRAILRGGDVGWNTQLEVLDGAVPNLVLGKAEQLWLQACWTACEQSSR